jgi:hypothetical protein
MMEIIGNLLFGYLQPIPLDNPFSGCPEPGDRHTTIFTKKIYKINRNYKIYNNSKKITAIPENHRSRGALRK